MIRDDDRRDGGRPEVRGDDTDRLSDTPSVPESGDAPAIDREGAVGESLEDRGGSGGRILRADRRGILVDVTDEIIGGLGFLRSH